MPISQAEEAGREAPYLMVSALYAGMGVSPWYLTFLSASHWARSFR